MPEIISPKDFFGFEPGSDRRMIHWNDLVAYYEHLGAKSPRVRVERIGDSVGGYPFLRLIITSENNMAHLEEYRQISCRLADPSGLSMDEIKTLAAKGKAVCLQTFGLHANEVGGPQAAPAIAFQLAEAKEPELLQVLENIIFIMIPCVNPYGQILYTEWYHRSLGQPWEGVVQPRLYHPYSGHHNNRDFIHENLIETKYVNDILYREWMPQASMDFHHQSPDMDRLSISPKTNPTWPEMSPLLMRADRAVGSQVAYELEAEGLQGVVAGDKRYFFYPDFALDQVACHSNIIGMLAEVADAMIATPVYLHPEKLKVMAYVKKCVECPSPWQGGEWGLPDIVRYMTATALSFLKVLAADPKQFLIRRAEMALEQIRRGSAAEIKGYLIPQDQHDPSALKKMLSILENHRVQYGQLQEDFQENGIHYPAGTYIVPCAQMRYSLVSLLFSRHPYPVEPVTTWPDGSIRVFDCAATNVSDPMGLNVFPYHGEISGWAAAKALEMKEKNDFPAEDNESFAKVNSLLKQGKTIYRDENGNFYQTPGEGRQTVRALKIGIFEASRCHNGDLGFNRLVLENYDFPVTTLMDRELRKTGSLDDYDVLILPGDSEDSLRSGDTLADGWPEDWRSGLGTSGTQEVERFVRRGGRLIAYGKSTAFVRHLFHLEIEDTIEKESRFRYYDYGPQINSQGSQLNINLAKDPLTLGMPACAQIKSWTSPAFKITAYANARNYETIARYPERGVLHSGLLVGEEFLAGYPCIVRAKIGKGEALLYAADPIFRAQSLGTYKLLFNALYDKKRK